MKKEMRGNLLLLLTALIWGSAFVAQSAGMDYVGPFTYNMARSYLGFLILIPVVILFRKTPVDRKMYSESEKRELFRNSIKGGICCGIALGIASATQQVGISMTTAGKAGFITALYIVIVPILGIIMKRNAPKKIWFCALLAVIGFYFLCINEDFSVGEGDLFCLLCALFFSIHIMVIDHFNNMNIDSILMSCIQFLVAALLSTLPALVIEHPTFTALWNAKVTILYAGVLSSGVAYTLQILGQRNTNPTVATLLMSLESVFAALFGWLILSEQLNPKELLGCLLVFIAVIIAQIDL